VLPTPPTAPAFAVPTVAPLDAPKSDVAVPVPAAIPASDEYLVAVGLFVSPERAEQVLDALTQAGLPAMLRPMQLRRQQVQQVALGPYFSLADATADLRRLQSLGGYDDANVIDSARNSSAQ
jgi:cell division septation protein DedD